MHLPQVLTVAAAILAASGNALPLSQSSKEQSIRSLAEGSSSSMPLADAPTAAKKRTVSGAQIKDTVMSYVQRNNGMQQQPILMSSARNVINDNHKRSEEPIFVQEDKRADSNSTTSGSTSKNFPSSTVPGAIKTAAETTANTTSVHGNATIISNDGSVTIANVTVSSNGTVIKTSASKSQTNDSLILLNNGTLTGNLNTNSTGKSRVSGTIRSTLSVGYWAEWTASTLPPESIPWSKYDIMNYAFAVPNSDGTIGGFNAAMLQRMVTAAHAAGKKLVLSIGGAGQSSGFVGATDDTASINTFITNLVALQKKYNLDGLDFDWEYPNNLIRKRGTGQDSIQFQTFLQALRPKVPTGTILAAAVPTEVWLSSTGGKVKSVARAAAALDYIFIMNYDVWGTYTPPGPNSPLANLCGNSTQPSASAAGSVKAWTAAGMPRDKIVLGLPMYGYLISTTKTTLIQKKREQVEKRATKLTDMGGGQINFNSIISQGALKLSTVTGNYIPTTGFTKYWDNCSDTPYLSSGSQMVVYDDPTSLQDKAQFAYLAGLAGAGVWSIDGDTSKYELINAIRAGLNKD